MEKDDKKEISALSGDVKLDNLLARYSILWIWSIIVGINSGLTYTFYSSRAGNYGGLSLVFIIVNVMSFAMSVMAWVYLYKVLNRIVLPFILQNIFKIKERESYFQKEGYLDISEKSNEVDFKNILELENSHNLMNVKLANFLISSSLKYVVLATSFQVAAYMFDGFVSSLLK